MTDLKKVLPEDAAANDPRDEDPHGVDLWIMPYIRDSSLWPVLIVLVAHVVAFVTPVLLFAVRDARIGPMIAIGVLAILTVKGFRWEMRTRRAFGAISWLIVVCWTASAIAAYFADRSNFF